MLKDIRFAFRMLVKNPGFSAVAILTLALGIGANTSIFSIVSTMFFRPLPVRDPAQLVLVLQKSAVWKMPHGHSWLDYRDYRDRVASFSDAIATMINPAHLSVGGKEPERAWVEVVSGNYFSMLGVEPALGRFFTPDEGEKPGGAPFAVLSHAYWKNEFGSDRSVLGKSIRLNGHAFTIVGVAPKTFTSAQWSLAPPVFVPTSMLGQVRLGGDDFLVNRGATVFKVIARLKPSVTLSHARSEVEVVAKQLAVDYPKEHRETTVFVASERQCRPEPTFAEFIPLIASVFMVMVLLVLVIACANVANLMFSRALVRQKEMGIRSAVGATRWHLIRQLLMESLLMGLLGGSMGILIAYWSKDLLSGFTPVGDLPFRTESDWDWRIPVFGFVMSLMAGVVTGLFPAFRATRLDLQSTLKDSSGALLGSSRHPFRSALVISQVAICLVVLVCSGLFVESLRGVSSLDLGFKSDHVVMASLDVGLQGYSKERGVQFYRDLRDRMLGLPGVRSVSLAQSVPFDYGFDIGVVAVEERAADDTAFISAHVNRVDHLYFETMRTPILKGRAMSEDDSQQSPKVAVINAAMAERLWTGQDALGKRFRWGLGGDLWEVIGIAQNGRYVMIGEEPRPYFYVPLAQSYSPIVTLHVRTEVAPESLAPSIRRILKDLDPHLPIFNVRTMQAHLHDSALATMPLRMGATLAGVQGVLGLILAVMGVYGVVSYVVSHRTREVGIRIALGAQSIDIVRLVVREGLRLALIGMSIGLLASAGLAQVVSRLLYGVTPSSLPVLIVVVLLLGVVSTLACWLPARRATRVDPMVALRCE